MRIFTRMTPDPLQALIHRIEVRYPGWTGINDPRFAQDELGYKRAAAAQAAEMLNAEALRELQAQGQFDEMLKRVRRLAAATNLLFMGVPRVGDLSLLNQGLDTAELCAALFDLLHGPDESPERLGRFIDFVDAVGATPKWALPTYLLFVVHPNTDVFVKPAGFQAFLNVLGASELWSTLPSAESYAGLLRLCNEIRETFQPYGAQDMIDVQSLIWVVAQTTRPPRRTKAQAPEPQPEPTRSASTATTLRELSAAYTTSRAPEPYSLQQCAADIGLSTDTLQTWLQGIARKRQAILYGPPGTGKTFAAHKLAQYLLADQGINQGINNLNNPHDGFVELVQFHPAYAYEDFVQGIRPTQTRGRLSYPLVDGRFLVFCKAAATRRGPCILIIDEINRADLARVFGELMYLLEYRDAVITLASGERFSIPTNVILLGTMNTADRSIALVDHALRRRFAFLPMQPNYALLRQFHTADTAAPSTTPSAQIIDALINLLIRINAEIADPQYALGTSFFLQQNLPEQLESIWRTEIEPYLEEYFFDQPARVDAFRWERIRPSLMP